MQASPTVQARIVALSIAELLRSSWPDLDGEGDGEGDPQEPTVDPRSPERESAHQGSDGPDDSEDDGPIDEFDALVSEDSDVDESTTEAAVESTGEPEGSGAEHEQSDSEPHGRRSLGIVIDVLLDVRGFIGYGGAQIGGRIGASFQLSRAPLEVGLDAGGWYGVAFDPLGSVDIISTTAAFSLLWTNRRADFNAGIGPRVELGWGRGAGRPDDADAVWGESFDAFLSIITLRAVARVRLSRLVLLLVDLQGGYVLSGIEARAADRRATGIAGPVIAIGLGVAIEPSAP
jgi:hypothetical protein